MHVQHLKRYGRRFWPLFSRLAFVAVILEAFLLLCWLPGRAAAESGITVSTITVKNASSYASQRRYAGAIVARRTSELGFKIAGQLSTVAVDMGAAVTQGELLASLDSASQEAALAEAQARVRVAKANIAALQAQTELAAQTEKRFANLHSKGHVSAQEYDEQRLNLQSQQAQLQVTQASLIQAQAAQRAAAVLLNNAQINAPFDGFIQARYGDEGSQLSPGQALLRLVETTNKEAHVGLPEQLASSLEPGMQHQLQWSGTVVPVTLTAILPEINANNRTLTAVYQLAQAPVSKTTTDRSSPPIGAVVELLLNSQVEESGYWLPLSALTESDRGLWGVYVVNDAQVVERRLVEIVHTENARAFVRGTLSQGDTVVATGVQRLVPGQRVSGVTQQAG